MQENETKYRKVYENKTRYIDDIINDIMEYREKYNTETFDEDDGFLLRKTKGGRYEWLATNCGFGDDNLSDCEGCNTTEDWVKEDDIVLKISLAQRLTDY